jgi:hypothetical protein
MFDPQAVALLARYNTLRYMGYQNGFTDQPVTWADRAKPGKAFLFDGAKDGIAWEYLIALSNQTKTNMWVNIPWKASDDYIRNAAILVRDTLDPTKKVYVETANEVWNFGYPVTTIAMNEGLAEGLSKDGSQALLRRYAERSAQVMKIWSEVFAGQKSRLVRVAATQFLANSAYTVLSFPASAGNFDAIAVAPYFNFDLDKVPGVSTTNLSTAFASMIDVLDKRTNVQGPEVREMARAYGVRMITYEAGQHTLISYRDDLVPLLKAFNTDKRMGEAYTRFLTQWGQQVGDLNTLFLEVNMVTKYGAWGQQEYPNQPLSQAPKAQAVMRYLASLDNKTD